MQVLRKFIAVFLVFTLFFNMNTVSFAGIIGAIEGTNPTDHLTTITPDSQTGELDDSINGTATEPSGFIKIFLDAFSWLGEVMLSPVIVVLEILPSPELFIFGGEPAGGNFEITSPTQLSFFTSEAKGLAGGIQGTTASIYNALRYLVTAFYIIILVYLSVRILLSSIGKQKAHYKSLLQYWILGLLLLFSFHWVMAFIIWLSDCLTAIFAQIGVSQLNGVNLVAGGKDTVTYMIAIKLAGLTSSYSGAFMAANFFSSFGVIGLLIGNIYSLFIALCCLVATIFIAFVYIKRLLFVALLIIVFPLVVLSYVFDKIGDRKSQTLHNWLREFVVNVCVQPIHALLLSFVIVLLRASVDEGSTALLAFPVIGPILALALLFMIPSAEKFLKQLFQISSSMGVGGGLTSAMSGIAHTGMALWNMNKLAQPLVGATKQAVGMHKISQKYGDILSETPRKATDLFRPGKRMQRALDTLEAKHDPRHAAIMNDVKELTNKDSWQSAKRATGIQMATTFTSLAAAVGAAGMGQGEVATLALKAGGLGKKFTDKNIDRAGHKYTDLANKIKAQGMDSLDKDDRKILDEIFGKNGTPTAEEAIENLEFKANTIKYGGIKDPKVAAAVLPYQRKNRERVFGENGILNTDEKNDYIVEVDKKNMTLKKKDGTEKITLLGEGDPSLRHPISIPASGIASAKHKSEILENTLDKIANDAGITTANGYSDDRIEKFKERKRSEVLDEIDTVSSTLSTLSNKPPIMKTVKPNRAIDLSVPAAQAINSFEALDNARMHPQDVMMSADDMNQIQTSVINSVDSSVHKPYLTAIKNNAAIQPQFDSVLTMHNINPADYTPINPSQKADFAGAMQEFHSLDATVPADCYSASGVQNVRSISDLVSSSPSTFGITDAAYKNIAQQAVAQAQSIQSMNYAQKVVTEIAGNTPSYAISTSEMNEILRTNNIDPQNLRPINNAQPNFIAAAESLRDLQEFSKPHSGTVIQAANDIIQGAVRYERSTATPSDAQLSALQNSGALQMTYSGNSVTITPVMNPDTSITVPSGINLSDGETIIKSGIIDPLNPSQILQTYADIDRFTLAEDAVATQQEGTQYDMDLIDVSKLPAGQFSLIRSGDYCVVMDSSNKIVYAQRGLTVIPDTHMVELNPLVNGNGTTEYVINQNSPVNSDMLIELKRQADLLKARSIGISDNFAKEQANLTQTLMNDLAIKLGLNVSK